MAEISEVLQAQRIEHEEGVIDEETGYTLGLKIKSQEHTSSIEPYIRGDVLMSVSGSLSPQKGSARRAGKDGPGQRKEGRLSLRWQQETPN